MNHWDVADVEVLTETASPDPNKDKCATSQSYREVLEN